MQKGKNVSEKQKRGRKMQKSEVIKECGKEKEGKRGVNKGLKKEEKDKRNKGN